MPRSSASIASTNRLKSTQKIQFEGIEQSRNTHSIWPSGNRGAGFDSRIISKLQWSKWSRLTFNCSPESRTAIQPATKGIIMDRQPGVYAVLDTSEGSI